MVSSLLGGIMNMFSENDGAMIKEDNEQGGGRNVRVVWDKLFWRNKRFHQKTVY
jgi:hypothetical protein